MESEDREPPDFMLYLGGKYHNESSEEEERLKGPATGKLKVAILLLGITFPVILILYLIYLILKRISS